MMVEEQWKPIEWTGGIYEVSNRGRVRSVEREIHYSDGRVKIQPGGLLSPGTKKPGYLFVLLRVNGKAYNRMVHRLIAEAFIPNPEGYPVVRHLNDVKDDNRIENLAWGTAGDNMKDKYRNGYVHPNKLDATHCANGHEWNDENTYWTKKGGRSCRTCLRNRARERRAREREERTANGWVQTGGPVSQFRYDEVKDWRKEGC